MFRNRFLILLGGCALVASAAMADDIGFIDCSKNAEGAEVFAKPRRSPEVLASVPCGERFTILVYGFVFSRIQTGDGKVGFVYSNLIAVDRSGASVQQTASPRMVTAADKVAIKTAPAAQAAPSAPAQVAPAQPAPAAASAVPFSEPPPPPPPSPHPPQNPAETTPLLPHPLPLRPHSPSL